MPVKKGQSRSAAVFLGPLWGLLTLIGAVGCEPRIKPEELGTPIYDESKLPGAGEAPMSLDRETPSES